MLIQIGKYNLLIMNANNRENTLQTLLRDMERQSERCAALSKVNRKDFEKFESKMETAVKKWEAALKNSLKE